MGSVAHLTAVPAPRTTAAGHRILRAASELFTTQGITATGVDLIADRAGVTKRTLYQRFGSKDQLIAAVLTARAHRWQTEILDALDAAPPLTAPVAIAVVFEAARRHTAPGRGGCAFVNAWAEVGHLPGPAADAVRAEKAWMADLFTAIVGDRDTAARVHQVYEGAQVLASISGDPGRFEDGARTAARLI